MGEPEGERRRVATGSIWVWGVISMYQPRHGTGAWVETPKATLSERPRLPLGASTGPNAYSW